MQTRDTHPQRLTHHSLSHPERAMAPSSDRPFLSSCCIRQWWQHCLSDSISQPQAMLLSSCVTRSMAYKPLPCPTSPQGGHRPSQETESQDLQRIWREGERREKDPACCWRGHRGMAQMSQGAHAGEAGAADVAKQALPRRKFLPRPGAQVGPEKWEEGQLPLWGALGSSTGYLCYKGIMKGRRGCPLQVYAGPPAGDLGNVLSGASCGERRRKRL